MSEYETIVGLEIHVQPGTDRKMFCNCLNRYGEKPNALLCPTCMGLPGALPVVNREAVERAIRAAVALNCNIQPVSHFARKNYFYPDLPKNYQISQYNNPYAREGALEITSNGGRKKIRINNAHMEEDTGKLLHGDAGRSRVDLNRAGVPLIEIVTEPDMNSPEEAFEFCTRLKAVLQYAGVSECNMEQGNLRVDVNVNVRNTKTDERTEITEIKNLNSFRYALHALKFEEKRHVEALKRGD
ncbi:MAG: Asp-tRNA(Asn)/Glu-tRNA(Gln) amidotransferase subunit GatB, partial [Planctomycetota bacterium]